MKIISSMVSKGSISLFLIAFVFSVIAGLITLPFAKELVTTVSLTTMAGILTTMGIGKLGNLVGMKLSDSDAPGMTGTMLAVILMLIVS